MLMARLSKQIISFYQSLRPPQNLPVGTSVLFPQQKPEVLNIIKQFYKKYYSDDHPRTLMLGINPGRFGAGATGINFTASKQLTENCGIPHSLKMQSELSAEFIYEVIERNGGPEAFYSQFFIGAVSPLGYIKNGKNINYYDQRDLQNAVTPFIVSTIQQQLTWNINQEFCICVGDGKNYKFLAQLNKEYAFFKEIVPLPHPRFILQYRRKRKEEYIQQYLNTLYKATGNL
jgi:hypothetical protein